MMLPSHPLLFVVLLLCSSSIVLRQLRRCAALSPDGLTLLAFKSAVSADPSSALAAWDETATDPCLWPGVTCANVSGFPYPRVVALSVPGRSLTGYIPSELGSLAFLRRLNLHGNRLSGPIPAQLSGATSLHSVYLHSNALSGAFPSSLCTLPRLQNLDISGNALSGAIPAELGGCRQLLRLDASGNRFSGAVPAGIWPALGSLVELDLSSNSFTGPIPPDLGDLRSLSGTLNLSHNGFSGEIPNDLGRLPAPARLDLRDNDLSGQIPQVGALSNQGAAAFLGNAKLCGFPLPNGCQELSPTPPGVLVSVPRSGGPGVGQAGKKGLKLEVIVLIALADAAGVAVVGLVAVYAYWKLKDGGRRGCSCTGKTKLGGRGGGGGGGHWSCSRCWKGARVGSPSSSPSSEEEEEEEGEGEASAAVEGRLVAMDKGFEFELDELLRASAYVVGKSRLGIVYKVVLGSGVPVAVRRLGEGGGGGAQRRREFAAEAQAIGRVRHPNVVRLRAFYWSPEEKLLVSDFVANGSLAAALRGGRSGQQAGLTWPVRLRIAKGTARGLAHIHECSKFGHGDIRPSNVLLDPDLTPRISDLGLLRLLHVAGAAPAPAADASSFPYPATSSSADGPHCYRAPEARGAPAGGRGAAQQKSDVYSFGLLLLELLTGRSPEFAPSTSTASHAGEAELVRWVRTGMEEEGRPAAELVDPALLWQARAAGEVAAAFRVALACAATDPEQRPRMRAVSDSLEKIRT